MRLHPLALAAALLAAGAARAESQGLNAVHKIEVQESDGAVAIRVEGSRPPSFTTFALQAPARFVVDLAESTLDGVPGSIAVKDGTINVVNSLAYPDKAMAGVMIWFARDTEPPRVRTEGNALYVEVTKPTTSRPLLVAAAAPVKAPAAMATPAASPAAPPAPAAVPAADRSRRSGRSSSRRSGRSPRPGPRCRCRRQPDEGGGSR